MPEKSESTVKDWNGSDVMFQGAPRWYSRMKEELLREAELLSKTISSPYGMAPEVKEELKAKQKDLLRQADNLTLPEQYRIPFSITGTSKPVLFSPEMLERASRDEGFARKLYENATGVTNPIRGDIEDFRSRIVSNVPNLHEIATQQRDYERKAYDEAMAKQPAETRAYEAARLKQEADYLAKHNAYEAQKREYEAKKAEHENALKQWGHDVQINSDIPAPRFTLQPPVVPEKPAPLPRLGSVQDIPDTEEKLLKRVRTPRELEELAATTGRVAPMNELHEEAGRLMRRNVGTENESFDVAKQEMKAARDRNIPEEVRKYLDTALVPTHERADEYMNHYQKNVVQALRDETKENFLEEVLPKINGDFAASGAFHSGARMNALTKFAHKSNDHLQREIARLMHSGYESSKKSAGEQSEREMGAAQLMGRAQKEQHESQLHNAEALAKQAVVQKELSKNDIAALNQFANQKQVQEQNRMTSAVNAHDEERLEPNRRLGEYANTMAGLPVTSQMTVVPPKVAPAPPNPYNAGAGIGLSLLGLQQQAQGHKKGGSVKRKFAEGGHVNGFHDFAKYVIPDAYDAEMAQTAGQLKNHHVSPLQNWMSHVGAQMLANNRGDPLANMGMGAMRAEEAMSKHHERMLDAKYKAGNLYNEMNKSRRDQQKLLAEYDLKSREHAEQARHHRVSEGLEAQRIAPSAPSEKDLLIIEHKKAQIDALKRKNEQGGASKKMIKESEDRITSNLHVINSLNDLSKDIEDTNTGPWIGWLKKAYGSDEADRIETKSSKIALDLQKGSKGLPRTQATMNLIKDTKPSITHSKRTNREVKNTLRAEAIDVAQDEIRSLLDYGKSIEEIQNRFNIKIDDDGDIELSDDGEPIPYREKKSSLSGVKDKNGQDVIAYSNEPSTNLTETFLRLTGK